VHAHETNCVLRLARFLRREGMNIPQAWLNAVPFEDRIEQLSRLVLVLLLLATLGHIV
jgi:hypothetical protein